MPRQQVYGKRSRAVYADFSIFDSPRRPTPPRINSQHEVTSLVHGITGLSIEDYANDVEKTRQRRTLGDIDANTVGSLGRDVGKKKSIRRRAKRVVDEEEESRDNAECPDSRRVSSETDKVVQSLEQEAQVVVEEVLHDDVLYDIAVSESVQDVPTLETIRLAKPTDEAQDCSSVKRTHNSLSPDRRRHKSNHEELDEAPPSAEAVDSNIYSQHCNQLLDLSTHGLSGFQEWAAQLSAHFSITKIAEASFGEVYRLAFLQQQPDLSVADESVFKIIPLQPPGDTLPKDKKKRAAALKKADNMSKPDDVANEVKLLQRMSSIPGFTNFRDVRIVQGRPPQPFIEAFKAWNVEQRNKKKDTSHFPDPSKKASHDDDQLWAVIEMQDAGTDLERLVELGQCSSIWSVWDIFWQVVLSLGKGEEAAEFEHRDLHLGNICVRQTGPEAPSATAAKKAQSIDTKKKLGFTTSETTIIDYTISRCQLATDHSDSIAYHDLALDSALFEGDSTEEYQYDIYRYMRSAVCLSEPLATPTPKHTAHAQTTQLWRGYHPITNLVWLHFVLYKLLEQLDWPSARKAPAKKRKEEHAVWKRSIDLEHALLKLQDLLDPEAALCKNGLRSASDVVGLALSEGWLDVADVIGEEPAAPFEALDEVVGDSGTLREVLASDEYSSEPLTHLVINVDEIEEHGLDVAQAEAKANAKDERKKKSRRKRSLTV